MSGFRVLLVLSSVLWLAGCLDESRLNARCESGADPSTARLDMRSAGDRQHLATDVRIAGENAVRYGDSAATRVGIPASVRIRFDCLNRLYSAIEARHAVTAAEVQVAARMRDVWIDVALIYLPVALLFFYVSQRLSRRLFRRMPPPGERWTVLMNTVWMGLTASLIATGMAHFHSWNIDALRLRNMHMSFRAIYLPIGRHPWQSYVVAVAIFAIAAWREHRAARSRSPQRATRIAVGAWQR